MKDFDHPYVVGIVADRINNKKNLALRNSFTSEFKRRQLPFVYLLLKVELEHLKNLLTCMRLMDVIGVNLSLAYEKKVARHLDRLDSSAKASGRVNVIAKKGHKFVGFYVERDLVAGSLSLWKRR